jgi:hypothetical protein
LNYNFDAVNSLLPDASSLDAIVQDYITELEKWISKYLSQNITLHETIDRLATKK